MKIIIGLTDKQKDLTPEHDERLTEQQVPAGQMIPIRMINKMINHTLLVIITVIFIIDSSVYYFHDESIDQ